MGEKPGWKLTPEEQRTQVITFVSGLASVLAGAAVVGIAIALGRWWSGKIAQDGWGQPLATSGGVIGVALAATFLRARYRGLDTQIRELEAAIEAKSRELNVEAEIEPKVRHVTTGFSLGFSLWMWRYVLVITWAFAAVVLLAWIGMAAGVK